MVKEVAMFNKYPYTDFHEMNLDWVIAKLKEISSDLDRIKQEAIDAATEAAKEYIDQELADVMAEFETVKAAFVVLDNNVATLSAQFNALSALVTAQIADIRAQLAADIAATNERTDVLIRTNNDYIFENLSTELAKIRVINYFTGESVTVQDMFNYLSMLHLNDSIDYDTMALRAKTYAQLALLNINFTNLAMHGNTLYV